MSALFAATLALSAALLFSIQPVVARMVLPTLGGTPAVWNTCMVFFQAAVLGGYTLAHLLATRLRFRPQAVLFLALVLTAIPVLPIRITTPEVGPPGHPTLWLLARLTLQAGLPALALATASPLLQRWYSRVRPEGTEPYTLYVASNLGSLGALLAYPLAFERWWPLSTQTHLWTAAYAVWVTLVGLGVLSLFRRNPVPAEGPPPDPTPSIKPPSVPGAATPRAWLIWAGLGAIPSSLLQGCTLFLTTDVASIPLLWVLPLALYLTTFIVAFSPRAQGWVHLADRLLPFLAVALAYVILSRATQPVGVLLLLHLGFLFAAGLVCHGRLVARRPAPEHLTSFYLALSLGGVLGSAFNALLAPHLFSTVAEYPLALAFACAAILPRALRVPLRGRRRPETDPSQPPTAPASWTADLATALILALALGVLGLVVPWLTGGEPRLRDALVFGLPCVACCTLLDRPRRLSLGLGATLMTGLWLQGHWTGTLQSERNFFGITRVTRDAEGRFHQLVHGNTFHGRQFTDPARRNEPLTYYHRTGPLGSLFADLHRQPHPHPLRIGVIGLGVGSSAAYARPGEPWVFFEIDPAVIRVATDTRWFRFLAEAQAREIRIVPGDARLELAREPEASFDLLLLDAFSSDAIPVHLLTREAFELYFRKLRPGGRVAAHISNRYLDLEPVFAALARETGLACRSADDPEEDPTAGKEASHWIVLGRTTRDLGRLAKGAPWVLPDGSRTVPIWTDQRAGVLDVFQWK